MATNDGNINNYEFQLLFLRNKSICPRNIQSSDTKQLLGIINTFLLQHLSSNRYGRVNWVVDNVNESIRTVISDSFNKCLHYVSIDVEKIITGSYRASSVRQQV